MPLYPLEARVPELFDYPAHALRGVAQDAVNASAHVARQFDADADVEVCIHVHIYEWRGADYAHDFCALLESPDGRLQEHWRRRSFDLNSVDDSDLGRDPERLEQHRVDQPMFVYSVEFVDDPEAIAVVPIRVTP